MLVDNYIPVKGKATDREFIKAFDCPNNRIKDNNYVGMRRGFIDDDGHPCVVIHNGRYTVEKGEKRPIRQKHRIVDLLNRGVQVPLYVYNATSLRKQEWQYLDSVVVEAARDPLVAAADLMAANSIGGFDAYKHSTYEYQAMSDAGEAVVDMTGVGDGRHSPPELVLRSSPLPITHSDFMYDDRTLAISGNSGMPLDTISAEQAGRRIGEKVEDTTIGTETGVTYGTVSAGPGAHEGTSTVYGMTNFTYRATYTSLTVPTGSNPQAVVGNVLAMIQAMAQEKYYGPFMCYTSLAYEQYLDNDYAFTNGSNWATNPGMTLRERLKAIKQIQDVKCLYRLNTASTYVIILVDLTKKSAGFINGQPPVTIMWESKGGALKHFKTWAIQTPLFRAEFNQASGVMHGTTS